MSFEAVKDFTYNGIQYSSGEVFSPDEYSDFNIKILLNNSYIKKMNNSIYSYIVSKDFIFDEIEYKIGDPFLIIENNQFLEKLLDSKYLDRILPVEDSINNKETIIENNSQKLEKIEEAIKPPKTPVKKSVAKSKTKKKKR